MQKFMFLIREDHEKLGTLTEKELEQNIQAMTDRVANLSHKIS